MPFTFSHPAIILPLTYLPRSWFSLTGLVVGSLTPDFEYFIRMRIQSNFSHTLGGLFWFDLPLGLLLAFIFHLLVRDSLFDNLPLLLKSRLSAFKGFDWNAYFKKRWMIVMISVLIGAASHIFWDGFTHYKGYFVIAIPALTNTVDLLGFQVPILKILQHSGTLIGGLVIAFAIFKLPVNKQVDRSFNLKYWGFLIGISLMIVSLRLYIGFDHNLPANAVVTVISASMIALLLTPMLVQRRTIRRE